MAGWIKVHRGILDNPIVCKDAVHFAVWMYLLANATHQPIDMMFEGKRISLIPGQLITSRKSIANKFDVDEYKVQRILKLFENEQQIAQQTTRHNRLISVLNWDLYQNDAQQNEQQLHNNCTTTAQQLHTNKNVRMKERKNEKNKEDINILTLGSMQNVKLTPGEYDKLSNEFPSEIDDAIEFLSLYIIEKGDKSKAVTHNATIRRWVIDAVKEKRSRNPAKSSQSKSGRWEQNEPAGTIKTIFDD